MLSSLDLHKSFPGNRELSLAVIASNLLSLQPTQTGGETDVTSSHSCKVTCHIRRVLMTPYCPYETVLWKMWLSRFLQDCNLRARLTQSESGEESLPHSLLLGRSHLSQTTERCLFALSTWTWIFYAL